MKIRFPYYVTVVYGLERLYPADPEQAEAYTALTAFKTISQGQKMALSRLGFEMVQVPNPKFEGR